jgi:hypothetical protein
MPSDAGAIYAGAAGAAETPLLDVAANNGKLTIATIATTSIDFFMMCSLFGFPRFH